MCPRCSRRWPKGKLRVIAYDQNDHTKLDEGTLLLVNNTVNQSSGAIQLKATFPNANRTLWPGEFVNVRLILGQQHNAISVPLDALQQGNTRPAGLRRRRRRHGAAARCDDRRNARRPCVGRQGLQPGDVVVTQGQYRWMTGSRWSRCRPAIHSVQNSTEASAGML